MYERLVDFDAIPLFSDIQKYEPVYYSIKHSGPPKV